MQKNIATPSITLDDLAVMVNKGFMEVHEDISVLRNDLEDFKVETRVEFNDLHNELDEFKLEVRSEFKDLKHVIGGHSRRISRVETKLQIA